MLGGMPCLIQGYEQRPVGKAGPPVRHAVCLHRQCRWVRREKGGTADVSDAYVLPDSQSSITWSALGRGLHNLRRALQETMWYGSDEVVSAPTAHAEQADHSTTGTANHAPSARRPRLAAAEPSSNGRPPGRPRPASDDTAAEVWGLVERVQAGEREAFALIYDRYVDTIFRFIYFRVGNRPLAEDLTSDTFLRALKRIGSLTWQGRDLGAWLITIARNLVTDHFKSGRHRMEITTADLPSAERADRGPEATPESAVVNHIANVALLNAVKQLNPEQQECIVLRFLQGLSVAETARAMRKNEGAIKALQYRAVRTLARLLPEAWSR